MGRDGLNKFRLQDTGKTWGIALGMQKDSEPMTFTKAELRQLGRGLGPIDEQLSSLGPGLLMC